jgi:hypothetical protein
VELNNDLKLLLANDLSISISINAPKNAPKKFSLIDECLLMMSGR